MKMSEAILETATDQELIDYILVGVENAAEYARARGIDIPPPPDPYMDQPVQVEDEGYPQHVVVTPDTPRSELPLEVLRDLIDMGDSAALKELHRRFPGLYDDAGQLTPEAAAIQEEALATLDEGSPEGTEPPGP